MRKYKKGGGGRPLTKEEKEKNIQLRKIMTTPSDQQSNINLNLSRGRGSSDIKNSALIGLGTGLLSAGIRTIPYRIGNRNIRNQAWDNFEDFQDSKFGAGAFGSMSNWESWTDYCENNTCPSFENFTPNRKDFKAGKYGNPEQWYRNAGLDEDWEREKHYTDSFKKAGRDAIRGGVSSYLWNKAMDTKAGKKLQKKLGMNINLRLFKDGGVKSFHMEGKDPLGRSLKTGGVKKYATAGMYDANVIPGSMNSTTNIVGAERDASILATNQAGMQSVADKLKADNELLASEIGNIEANEDAKIQEAADKVGRGAEATMGTVGKGMQSKTGKKLIKSFMSDKGISAATPSLDPLKNMAASATTGTNIVTPGAINVPGAGEGLMETLSAFQPKAPTMPGITPPVVTPPPPVIGGAANIASNIANVTDKVSKFKGLGTTGMEFTKLAAKGTQTAKLAAGAGKFLTSGAGLGTVATLAGKGISKLSDDSDATKSNVGEYAGSILSSAGTGASFGSMLGPVGTAVGAIGGAIYGAGKQFIGTRKAKKEKERIDAAKRVKQEEYNEQLEDQMGTQLSRARAGEMEQKTYSGYDLGRNVTYALGGGRVMRGMPRYGYAA